MIGLIATLVGCETSDPGKRPLPTISVDAVGTSDLPDPIPTEPEQPLDYAAIEAVRDRIFAEGVVAGRILRNALLITGLDSVSAGIIDADLAWYEGQQVLADTLLTNVKPAEWEGELFVLASSQRR